MAEDDTYNRLMRTNYAEVYERMVHIYVFETTVFIPFEEFLSIDHILPEYIKRDQLLTDHYWTRQDFVREYEKKYDNRRRHL
jgi:hypothetical protein